MDDLAGDGAAEDSAPVYSKGPTVSRPGDLWLLGKHRLLCGDARKPADYDRLMGPEKAEFIFTDLPTI